MNVKNFKNLPDHEQLRIVFNKAKFVDSTERENSVFALYSMKSFFIELQFEKSTFSLSSKRAFESDHKLNKYLNWDTAI